MFPGHFCSNAGLCFPVAFPYEHSYVENGFLSFLPLQRMYMRPPFCLAQITRHATYFLLQSLKGHIEHSW